MTGPAIVRRMALGLLAAALAVLSGCGEDSDDRVVDLPPLGADISATSVSGISSGAYMAGQFQIAHSRHVVGAGIIAGGPYGCAQSVFADIMPGPGMAFLNLQKAINGCMLNTLAPWGVPDVESLVAKTKSLAEKGSIDPLADLKDDRVYLFSGKNDRTVVPAIVKAAYAYYRTLGLSTRQVTYVSDLPAGHAFVTETEGLACEDTGKPYLVDCDYDQAGALLAHIYGKLEPRVANPRGAFVSFDQRPFFEGVPNHDMKDRGVAYLPTACRSGTASCRVHIAFHGCGQNIAATGDAFIRGSGFANWADRNALIVLFPQAAASPMNPQGCWDWWGFTGRAYLTRDAAQIGTVFRMLERLGRPPGPSTVGTSRIGISHRNRG